MTEEASPYEVNHRYGTKCAILLMHLRDEDVAVNDNLTQHLTTLEMMKCRHKISAATTRQCALKLFK